MHASEDHGTSKSSYFSILPNPTSANRKPNKLFSNEFGFESELLVLEKRGWCRRLQGYLAHKKTPTPLGRP